MLPSSLRPRQQHGRRRLQLGHTDPEPKGEAACARACLGPETQDLPVWSPQQGSGWRRTFELWDLPRRAFWQPFVASVARQGHSDSAASEQEPDLLASGVLGEATGRQVTKPGRTAVFLATRGLALGREPP